MLALPVEQDLLELAEAQLQLPQKLLRLLDDRNLDLIFDELVVLEVLQVEDQLRAVGQERQVLLRNVVRVEVADLLLDPEEVLEVEVPLDLGTRLVCPPDLRLVQHEQLFAQRLEDELDPLVLALDLGHQDLVLLEERDIESLFYFVLV